MGGTRFPRLRKAPSVTSSRRSHFQPVMPPALFTAGRKRGIWAPRLPSGKSSDPADMGIFRQPKVNRHKTAVWLARAPATHAGREISISHVKEIPALEAFSLYAFVWLLPF